MTAGHVTRATMIELLLSADPSFEPRWGQFIEEWGGEKEPPLYVALGSLAEHILDRLGSGDTEGMGGVFAVVERWHIEGDAYVSEAATIGLLESLQNQLGGNNRKFKRSDGVTVADVEAWLGPETRRWWDKLYRFWAGDRQALRPDT